MENNAPVELTEEEQIQAAIHAAKLAVIMTSVKLDASFVGNKFTMTFRQGVAKGEKFDRTKSEIFMVSEYDVTELPEKLFIDCPFSRHGLKQKMSDNLAMPKDDKEKASIKDAISKTDDLWKQLVAGDFNAVGKSSNPDVIKVDTKLAKEGLANMSDADREAAVKLMASLGIKM